MKSNQARQNRTLNGQHLEMRRLLAGDLATGAAMAPQGPPAENPSIVGDIDPPETRNRGRNSDEVQGSDGAHQRPGRGWDNSSDEAASAIGPVAVDIAIVAENIDPPETQQRGRISDEVQGSDGAHQRPGRGWDISGDEAAPAIFPLAIDTAIVAKDIDPPETQKRGRISDEVQDSQGAHKRPGRGWDS